MKQGVIRRLTGGLRVLCLTAACSLCMLADAGAQAPSLLPVQGFLTDKKGAPVEGETDIRFRLYSSSDPTAAGTQVLFEELQTVSVKQGNFTVYLGDGAASGLDLALFASHPNVWLGIKVAGESSEMSPLLQLATVPYAALAQKAQDASSLSGKKATDFLAASYVPDWSALSGKPASFPPSAHRHPWSDLDGIPSSLADGDSDSFATYSCSNAQILKSTGSGWSCANETTLSEAQVDAYVANNGFFSSTGGTISGNTTITGNASVSGNAGISGALSANSLSLNASRTEYFNVPGIAFSDLDMGSLLVQHTTTGRLYFSKSAATTDIAYPVASVQVPAGAQINEVGCIVTRPSGSDGFGMVLRRTNGDGTATSIGSYNATTTDVGSNITLKASVNEKVGNTGSYFIATSLGNASGGAAADTPIRLQSCYVRYTRSQL